MAAEFPLNMDANLNNFFEIQVVEKDEVQNNQIDTTAPSKGATKKRLLSGHLKFSINASKLFDCGVPVHGTENASQDNDNATNDAVCLVHEADKSVDGCKNPSNNVGKFVDGSEDLSHGVEHSLYDCIVPVHEKAENSDEGMISIPEPDISAGDQRIVIPKPHNLNSPDEVLDVTLVKPDVRKMKGGCPTSNKYEISTTQSEDTVNINKHLEEQNDCSVIDDPADLVCDDVKDPALQGLEHVKNTKQLSDSNNEKYVCKSCDMVLCHSVDYELHMRIHFQQQASAARKKKEAARKLKCRDCKMQFKNRIERDKHKQIHASLHSVQQPFAFKCEFCWKSFKCNSDLRKHLTREHDDPKPYKCKVCGEGFAYAGDAAKHRLTHNESQSYKCSKCKKTYKSIKFLELHMKRHLAKEKFVCTVCNNAFATAKLLKEHAEVHLESESEITEKPFCCRLCFKRFRMESSLQNHFELHDESEKRKVIDPINATSLMMLSPRRENGVHASVQETISSTQKDPNSSKPFHQESVSEDLSTDSQLKNHELDEALVTEKPYSCHICNKRFRKELSLKNHIEIHDANRHSDVDISSNAVRLLAFPQGAESERHVQEPQEKISKSQKVIKIIASEQNVRVSTDSGSNRSVNNLDKDHSESESELSKSGKQFRLESSLKNHIKLDHENEQTSADPGINVKNLIASSSQNERQGITALRGTQDMISNSCKTANSSSSEQHQMPQQDCNNKRLLKSEEPEHSREIDDGQHGTNIANDCSICDISCDKNLVNSVEHVSSSGTVINSPEGIQFIINFDCTLCNISFDDLASFSVHMNSHNSIKSDEIIKGTADENSRTETKWKCTKCGKEFTNDSELKQHTCAKSSSEDEASTKPYHCEFCEKRFRLESSLNNHIEIHREKDEQPSRPKKRAKITSDQSSKQPRRGRKR